MSVVNWTDVRYRHRVDGRMATIIVLDPGFKTCSIAGASTHINTCNDFGLLDHLLREEGFQPVDPLPSGVRALVLQAARCS